MAKKYDFKVEYLNTNVTQKDIDSGESGRKVANQVEIKLQEMMDNGFEYYGRTTCNVNIKPGCTIGQNNSPSSVIIHVNIFRKEK